MNNVNNNVRGDKLCEKMIEFYISENKRLIEKEEAFWKPKGRRGGVLGRPPSSSSSSSSSSSDEDSSPPLHFRSVVRRKRALALRESRRRTRPKFIDASTQWETQIHPVGKLFRTCVDFPANHSYLDPLDYHVLPSSTIVSFRSQFYDQSVPEISPTMVHNFRFSRLLRCGRNPPTQVQRRLREHYSKGMMVLYTLWKHFDLSGGRGEFLSSLPASLIVLTFLELQM